MDTRQLTGTVPAATDHRDELILKLQADNNALYAKTQKLRWELALAKSQVSLLISGSHDLRRTLTPLYRGMQKIFGDVDAMGVEDAPSTSSVSSSPDPSKWDEWKRRLGPSCAKVIDALLLGGEMSVEAIRVSAKMGQQTVYDSTSKMGRAGILVKNGGKFSLKQ